MRLGNIELDWLGHSGFLIRNSKIIYIDPYKISSNLPKADLILLSHSHYDHCSIEDLRKVVKENTSIIITPDCQSSINKIKIKLKTIILEPGREVVVGDVKIKAVPAYNIDKNFHEKAEYWNGYIFEIEGKKIYHAGDSDLIPEMQELGKIDVALLPVGGVYTMTAEEAARAAFLVRPRLAIPMHYGEVVGGREEAERFYDLCRQEGIEAEVLEKI